MPLRRLLVLPLAALALSLGCRGDTQCTADADCGPGYACVPDSSSISHCISDQDLFAPEDAGTTSDGGM